MNKETGSTKGKTTAFVKVLYVISAFLAVVFVFMLVTNIQYINSYTASYGMGIGDMWADAIKYIVGESIPYIVYALILFGIAKILCMFQNCCAQGETDAEDISEEAAVEALAAEVDEAAEAAEAEAETVEEEAGEAEEEATEEAEEAEEEKA